MVYNKTKQNKGILAIMFLVLTLLILYIANLFPATRVPLYFVCSIFIMGIMFEQMIGVAIIGFISVACIGYLILPDKSGILPYLLFFGHYGIFKYFIECGNGGFFAWVLKMLYFNVCMILIYFFDGGFLSIQFTENFTMWVAILVAQGSFILYDWLFGKLSVFYYAVLRNRLLENARG